MQERYKNLLPLFVNKTPKIIGVIISLIGLLGLTLVTSIFYITLSNINQSGLNESISHLEESTGGEVNNPIVQLDWSNLFTIPELANIQLIIFPLMFYIFLLILSIGIMFLVRYRIKKNNILKLINHGERRSARVVSNHQNFSIQMNRTPRREILFQANDGKQYRYHFFGERMAQIYPKGLDLTIVIGKKEKAIPAPEFLQQVLMNTKENTFNS